MGRRRGRPGAPLLYTPQSHPLLDGHTDTSPTPEWQYPAPPFRRRGRDLSFDVERLRERFPTLAHKTYLNSGSYGLLCPDVRRAFTEYLDTREERGSDWPGWMAQQE